MFYFVQDNNRAADRRDGFPKISLRFRGPVTCMVQKYRSPMFALFSVGRIVVSVPRRKWNTRPTRGHGHNRIFAKIRTFFPVREMRIRSVRPESARKLIGPVGRRDNNRCGWWFFPLFVFQPMGLLTWTYCRVRHVAVCAHAENVKFRRRKKISYRFLSPFVWPSSMERS